LAYIQGPKFGEQTDLPFLPRCLWW